MRVDNVYYITRPYDSSVFRVLLELQLSKPHGSPLSSELIEQCISAYIECKKNSEYVTEVKAMETFMGKFGIQYADFSCYDNIKAVNGNPIDAVNIFNHFSRNYFFEKN